MKKDEEIIILKKSRILSCLFTIIGVAGCYFLLGSLSNMIMIVALVLMVSVYHIHIRTLQLRLIKLERKVRQR